jgi:endonuclease-8
VPEGDTVWLSAKLLSDALTGQVLTRSEFRVPRLATSDLTGRRVLEILARGKHMLTRLDGGLTLHTHFRMTGTWRIFTSRQKWRGGPAHEIRIVLGTERRTAVGYRIPVIELVETAREDTVVGHLGPDLLGPDWDADEAVRRLRAQPDREIGQALLDQRNLAGIGNLYKAEVLYLTGVSPWTVVTAVPDLNRMVVLAHRLLGANRDHWPQVTTGNRRPGEDHYVFERAGRPCRRCGTPIRMAMQGDPPYDRVTYWCPVCQAGPAPDPPATAAASRPA